MKASPDLDVVNDDDIQGGTPGFLAGGGEMGALIRAYRWDSSPLGAPENWSQGLKTAVRLLLSTGHPMFIWWGPDLIQFYNDAYRRSIGPERHPSALGQGGRECWAEIWHIIGPQIEQVMGGEGHTWQENQLVPITRHGQKEDVYWTYGYGPIDDPDAPHGVGGVLVVCTETTAQVLAEQRIKAAEARWRALFTQAPGFMCILTGPDHIFEFANPRYFDLLDHRDIIGKTVRDALPEVEQQGFVDLLDKVYRTGKAYTGTALPLSLRQSDGSSRNIFLDFVYEPIRDASGEIAGIFVNGYDVTDRVISTEILREEDRRKDEFLAMLAHELRNPLAPIRNASELLTHSDNTETQSIGELLIRQVTQLSRLVDDLLDVSRITKGRIELQQNAIELGNAIAIAIESIQSPLMEKRHKLSYTPGDQPLYIKGDLTRIVQCLANILTNAIKYTDSGGHIRVVLREADGMAVLEIKDNGIGISPEMLPRIFELFTQAERAMDRSQGGLGIGLSVVYRLVKMHDGTITAMSDGLGHGSTFQISLPLIEPPCQQTPAREEIRSCAVPKRVLIVDDNIDAANSLAQLLKFKGHHTSAVYNARDALTEAETFAADVILLDIGLPDMNGYEVAKQLRQNRQAGAIVALTGYGQAEDIQRAREAGFDNHVTKPVALEDLERMLEEA